MLCLAAPAYGEPRPAGPACLASLPAPCTSRCCSTPRGKATRPHLHRTPYSFWYSLGTGHGPTNRGKGRDVSGFVFATTPQAKPSSLREAVAPALGVQLSSDRVPRRTVLHSVSASSQGPPRLPRPHTILISHTKQLKPHVDLRAQPNATFLMKPSQTTPARVTLSLGVLSALHGR